MKLKEILFLMENCEAITIDGKYIGHFMVDKIEKGIYRLASNHIGKTKTANRIVIEIHKNANREDYVFGSKNLGKQFTFDRLKQGDITQIEFILEDKEGSEKFHFFADWCGESEDVNSAQKTYESKCGHLYLVIEDGKSVEDYFDKEEIDEESYMNFYFDMMDVG